MLHLHLRPPVAQPKSCIVSVYKLCFDILTFWHSGYGVAAIFGHGGNLSFEIPIVVIVFNRPEITIRLSEAVRKVRPSKLFVVSNGPLQGNSSDFVKVEQARAILATTD